jgi:hypothetical protein
MRGAREVKFYVGLHQPSDAKHFEQACISINRLLTRRQAITARLLVDSGAFSELSIHGRYRHAPSVYADQLRRLGGVAAIDVVVAQDYMCEPWIVAKTGLSVGVGSICKRNGDPAGVRRVLRAIREARPDLELHGFGLKITTLRCPDIVDRLASADSMAWSYHARKQGRSANDWREAKQFERAIYGGN